MAAFAVFVLRELRLAANACPEKKIQNISAFGNAFFGNFIYFLTAPW